MRRGVPEDPPWGARLALEGTYPRTRQGGLASPWRGRGFKDPWQGVSASDQDFKSSLGAEGNVT